MDEEKLSQMYFVATASIGDASCLLYEYLHPKGKPQTNYDDEMERELKKCLAEIRNHFDLIRESVKEYNETKI
jgi:hypothetical protein